MRVFRSLLACVQRVQMGGHAARIGMKRGQKIGLNLPHAGGQLIFSGVEFQLEARLLLVGAL
jgi:hypothetical protein